MKTRATELAADLVKRRDETRAAVPAIDIAMTAFERDGKIGGFVLAGAIAFRLFVYVLPMYLVVLVVAGAAFSFDPDSPSRIARSTGISSYMASTLSDAADTSRKSLWILLPVTVWALLVAGQSAHKVIATAHRNAWGTPPSRNTRPHTAAASMVVFALAVIVVMLVVRFFRSGILTPFAIVLGAVLYTGLWLVASMRLPRDPRAAVVALLPGAILVGVGTQGLYLFNVLYLNRKIEAATEAYGALGIAASGLLWLYLLGRLLVAAPVLNATLWERYDTDVGPDTATGASERSDA